MASVLSWSSQTGEIHHNHSLLCTSHVTIYLKQKNLQSTLIRNTVHSANCAVHKYACSVALSYMSQCTIFMFYHLSLVVLGKACKKLQQRQLLVFLLGQQHGFSSCTAAFSDHREQMKRDHMQEHQVYKQHLYEGERFTNWWWFCKT